jgi:hypothetical protein
MARFLCLLSVAALLAFPVEAADVCNGYAVRGARADAVPLGVVADVNGDGIPDIVSTHSVFFGGTVEVETGAIDAVARVARNGPFALLRISFSQMTGFSLDALRVTPDGRITIHSTPLPNPGDILAVGDVNGDGIDDVILRNQIRFGSTDGTFTSGPALPFVLPAQSSGIAVGDFDGDHHLDMAVPPIESSARYVTIYSGDGTGNFHKAREVVEEGDLSDVAIVVADVDGDGVDDLIINRFYGIDIVPSRPGATLLHVAGTGYESGSTGIEDLIVGDFNGYGMPDVAANVQDSASNPELELRVWLNDGTGIMNLAGLTKMFPRGYETEADILRGGAISSKIFARDVDGDGKDDLVLSPIRSASRFVDRGAVLYSRGDGSFAGLPTIVVPGSGPAASGDLDGDGDDDVVLSSVDRSDALQPVFNTVVLWNDGNGAFHTTTFPSQIYSPVVADVDGDGKAELLQRSSSGVSVWKVTPDGVVTKVADIIPSDSKGPVMGYAVGRFSGAGPEIAFVEGVSPASQVNVEIFDVRAPATPRFSATITAALPPSMAFEVVASDLNGDGRDDLVIVGVGTPVQFHNISLLANGYVLALLSTATSFESTALLHQSSGAVGLLAAGDFNGDGIGDAAFEDKNAGLVFLYGERDTQFHSQTIKGSDFPVPDAFTVSDLDGDGMDDIAATTGDTLELLFGSPTGMGRSQAYLANGDLGSVLALRPHPGGVPWLFGATGYPGALLWSPGCERGRAVRH